MPRVFKFREFDVRRRTSGGEQNDGEASDETFHIGLDYKLLFGDF